MQASRTALPLSVLLLTASAWLPPLAGAGGSCAAPMAMGNVEGLYVPGSVSVDRLASDESDWYDWHAGGPVTYVMMSLTGDADLIVYDTSCEILCESHAGIGVPEVCTLGEGYHILEVRWFASPLSTDIHYLLAAAFTP